MPAMDSCDLFLAPWGCLAVPDLCLRMLMNHNLGLFQLSCGAELVQVSGKPEEVLARWVVLVRHVTNDYK